MATVELRFSALPEHVRTARLVAVSIARRAGVDDETLDEVRLAVGEAATRAVGRHRASCPSELVLVRLSDGDGRFVAEVVDVAPVPSADGVDAVSAEPDLAEHAEADPDGVDALDEPLPEGIDLAVIGSLVDDVTVETDGTGSIVRMAWPVVPDALASGGSAQPVLGTTPPSA
jgi:anti-sigma regulatory factor (Ser/Thr protein kinase)